MAQLLKETQSNISIKRQKLTSTIVRDVEQEVDLLPMQNPDEEQAFEPLAVFKEGQMSTKKPLTLQEPAASIIFAGTQNTRSKKTMATQTTRRVYKTSSAQTSVRVSKSSWTQTTLLLKIKRLNAPYLIRKLTIKNLILKMYL